MQLRTNARVVWREKWRGGEKKESDGFQECFFPSFSAPSFFLLPRRKERPKLRFLFLREQLQHKRTGINLQDKGEEERQERGRGFLLLYGGVDITPVFLFGFFFVFFFFL